MCRISRSVFTASALFALAFSVASVCAQEPVETDGIVYKKTLGRELMLDMEVPSPPGVARPALIFLCGNGWGEFKSISREEFSYGLDLATSHGYVGVTVDYSSYQENNNRRPIGTFPAQLYDVKSAIRFLRANAKKYDIDPTRIAVIGQSSGAHLALLAGLTKPTDGLEGEDEYSQYPTSVQAVVNFAGPTDLVMDAECDSEDLVALLGASLSDDPAAYKRASPTTYVRADAPPILTIHGDMDNEVPVAESLLLDKKMKEVGASHSLVIIKGGGHMDFTLDQAAVWDFLDKVLRR